MTSSVTFRVSPYLPLNSQFRPRCRVQASSSVGGDSTVSSSPELVVLNGAPPIEEREKLGPLTGGNGYAVSKIEVVEKKKKVKKEAKESLEGLWDDAYGTKSVKDYLERARYMIRPDGGPPRWFCPVECGHPLNDSPVLLFLPGLDGTGLGLVLHHKALGRAFEVRCLHIPVYDRTPFQDQVTFVEKTVKAECASSPHKPIYLVGDSFGGCLALAVAARNPTIDLAVILVNPATSFGRSQLQPLLPLLEAMPDGLHFTVPYLLSFVVGDPVKMATVNIDNMLPPRVALEQLSVNLTSLLPHLSGLADIIPRETLLWKLRLLKSAASYTNSRLHAVKAEVLLLASGKDNMLPSHDEAQRLTNSLKNCRVRYFKDNGHTLLLEDGINLLTVIKGTHTYRRRRRHDYVLDFLPPSMSEYKLAFNQVIGPFRNASSSALFSTLEDGKIVRGLSGVPSEGPVLLVGYHMLLGLELFSLVEEFLREKNVIVRGIAHPMLFSGKIENLSSEFGLMDWIKVFGAVPVTGSNLFKLFSTKSHVLLYPGGSREAGHYKGEEYKLFWPDQPEFVRMAARFGATIVPFGTVGEDDITELVLDNNDLMKIPLVNDYIRESSRNAIRVREDEALSIPVILPRIPGRFYYLFGKPIETRGRYESLKDRENANELYSQVKSGVESCIAYLLKKREEDPYRNIFDRTVHRALHSPLHEIPAFDP
ncbi:phytyl ester synthase 1, chloroplastic-like isoform X1 [Syzygium oleosum]|uniref:phytyl ester synthase 1, chloroplastic-like isoform X1 n=2 Tax=Syzygium oleosum TaxID=219896 RepID=UPI0011D21242|nr:phytyl ester synthase 1, chloroplastic-like isoform X1 [Syzygium oleosum]XP_056168191.1 phytyl ester synthase 1, chloroplastic-like isoform X1 [Syzygium oleosum]